MAHPPNPCQTRAMTKPGPMAGGFFIFAAIIAGFAWGAATGQTMRGVLIGTIAGMMIAALVWIFDRTRRP